MNGLEYIKGVVKVVIRILVTIDMSHVDKQIPDLICVKEGSIDETRGRGALPRTDRNRDHVKKAVEAEEGLENGQ